MTNTKKLLMTHPLGAVRCCIIWRTLSLMPPDAWQGIYVINQLTTNI